jgi:hypothetical protein
MAIKEQQKKDALWREILYSSNTKIIEDALKSLRDNGSVNLLPDIFSIYKGYKGSELGKKIFNFLCDVKCTEATPLIISLLDDVEYLPLKQDILSICWQSRLDFSDYLEKFIDLFINEDLSIAFEAFTVIEYLELDGKKELVEKNIEKLTQSISDISDDKKELLVDLVDVLRKKL